ncbi:MAG: hypothetical protein K2K77_03410, partial [Duncaniella sp.]|nr:hypothetical protein [Duncaniella sp.]
FYGFEGPVDDGVAINVLADSLRTHYDTGELFRRYDVARDDSMKVRTYANNERLALMLDSIVKELPVMLADVPVSAFAKDVLSVCIIGDVCEMMEDLDMIFRYAKGPNVVPDPVEGIKMIPGETLDPDSLLAPRRRHFALMYDNPLMLCRGWILPNRWAFNTLFLPTCRAAEGHIPVGFGFVITDEITGLVRDDLSRLDSIGIDNCFVPQLVRAAALIERINSHTTPSSASLAKNGLLIANVLRYNDYEPLAEALMSTYSGMVQDVMIAENRLSGVNDNSILIDSSAEGDVLQKIIAPYRGNVLFLDFWGIGCGPCRGGMIGQKPMLAEYADKPFKALYIANADDG